MTEYSWPWSTVAALGDGASELGESNSRSALATVFRVQDPASEGVSIGVGGELEVTGVASPLQVDTGSAVCYGLYWSDAAVNVAVSTPAVGTTGGRIVLQTYWAGSGGASLEARTRIALLLSADGVASHPGVTQTVGVVWEISLATFTITTGGVIAVTDDRTYRRSTAVVGAAEIENRTRSFFVQCTNYYNITDGTYNDFFSTLGCGFQDNKLVSGYGHFSVPSDFVSGLTVTALVRSQISANVYCRNEAYYGADGEAYNIHTATSGYAAEAVVSNQNSELRSISLSSATIGDFISLLFTRDATNVLDTIGNNIYIAGWFVTYTADS